MSTDVKGQSDFRVALPWVVFVSTLFALSYSARCALSPLLVFLEADLQIGHTQATSLLFMQGFGLSVSLGIGGFLLSKIKPARMVAFSIFCSGLCFLSMPLWTTLAQLRIAFFVFGFSAGLYFPAGMSTLGTLVSFKDWGKAVGIHELAPNLSFIIFPLVAQFILMFTMWRGVLVIWGILMIVVAVLFYFYGKGGQEYAEPPSISGALGILCSRTTWIMMLLLGVSLVGEYAIFSILQLYLVNDLNVTPSNANGLLALSRLLTPFMVILGGIAADRFSVRNFLCFGFILHAIALFTMGFEHFYVALAGTIFQAASIALIFPSIFKLLAECYNSSLQPVVLSICMPLAGFFGTGTAPSALGFIGENFGFGPGLIGAGVLSLLCIPAVYAARKYTE